MTEVRLSIYGFYVLCDNGKVKVSGSVKTKHDAVRRNNISIGALI